MDRTASLFVRASGLRRKLFASLPWGLRLAHIFIAMNDSMLEPWGRQLGVQMLLAGVTGMPDPGRSWNPEKPDARKLPRGYLLDLAKDCFALAMKEVKNPLDASDALQDMMVRLISGANKLKAVTFSSAKSFLLTAAMYAAKAIKDKQKSQTSIDDVGDDDQTLELVDDAFANNPHWYENPKQFASLESVFTPKVWEHEVIPAIKTIHVDMPLFFDLLGEGHTAEQIVQESMLPHFDPNEYSTPVQTWNAKVQKVKKVLRDIAQRDDLDPYHRDVVSLP